MPKSKHRRGQAKKSKNRKERLKNEQRHQAKRQREMFDKIYKEYQEGKFNEAESGEVSENNVTEEKDGEKGQATSA